MPIDDDVIDKARRYDVGAVSTIFAECYPMVHRVSHALTGRASIGREVERFVLKRALRVLPNWADEGAPKRWFSHHAVLASRRVKRGDPNDPDDLLLAAETGAQLAYVAFIRAVRALPIQQREAFLLTHGEPFTIREASVAMDCSNRAASTHLAAATASLRAIAGDQFDSFTRTLVKNYQALVPSEHLVLPSMRAFVAKRIWPARIIRAMQWLVTLAVLVGLVYLAWKLWPMLEF